MRFAMAVMAATLVVPAVQAQPADQMPEETAYRILFQLMRSRAEGPWNSNTQLLWLKSQGIPEQYFGQLWMAAERYWRAIEPYERDLRSIHERFAGRNDSPEARAAEKPAKEKIAGQYRMAKQDLEGELGSEGMAHLERLIARIRKEGRRAGKAPANGAAAGHAHGGRMR